jgi:LysM repeat protein
MPKYVVKPGDTLSKIARQHKLNWAELYNHAENADFRRLRSDPNRIRVGDVLWVPDNNSPDEFEFVVPVADDDVVETDLISPDLLRQDERLYQHSVQDGESLGSLAKELGIEWEDIALLNWGTTEPDKINYYLEHDVGCSKKAGANFVFSSSDSPGIILLPAAIDEQAEPANNITIRASRFLPG